MKRVQLYGIALSDGELKVLPVEEIGRRIDLGQRQHMAKTLAEMLAHPPAMKRDSAEGFLEKLTADPVEVTVREAFGPEGHRV